jgi:23S rRNA (uracil1939-C5)-methyltransferase
MSAPLRLTMEKAVYGGDCLSRLSGTQSSGKQGKTVFVPLTLPGEIVSAHVIEEKRTFARAEPEAILTASPDRIAPFCPHFGVCGGCQYQHAGYSAQLALKQEILHETLSRAGVALPAEIEVLSGDPWAYRNRIRLAFAANGEVGYRGRASHRIVPIRECPIAAPVLMECALAFASIIPPQEIPEDIAEVELFTNHDSSEILMTLHRSQGAPTVRGFRFIPGEGRHQPQIERSSHSWLTYAVGGFAYRVDGGAFFQVNRHLAGRFAEAVTAGLSGESAWDLYAGVGLFARRLAESFSLVTAVESAPASLEALRENLSGSNAQAVAATTLEYLRHNREQRLARSDAIVVDPPRAGLGEEVTYLLNAIGAPQMVYVSCDPATLARDLRALTQERYKIYRICLVDMFPQTFHIETVVHLSRS